jgi:hypothetical protein
MKIEVRLNEEAVTYEGQEFSWHFEDGRVDIFQKGNRGKTVVIATYRIDQVLWVRRTSGQ